MFPFAAGNRIPGGTGRRVRDQGVRVVVDRDRESTGMRTTSGRLAAAGNLSSRRRVICGAGVWGSFAGLIGSSDFRLVIRFGDVSAAGVCPFFRVRVVVCFCGNP